MTQDEIIRMEREAFGEQNTDYIHPKALERFFNLAFEAGVKQEREKQVDLTDDELFEAVDRLPKGSGFIEEARAVIAAYEEKNK